MKNIHDFLKRETFFSVTVNPDFSLETFLRQNSGLINSIGTGIGEDKSPLHIDYSGEMLFCIYKVIKDIEMPRDFLQKAVEHQFILPGFKGLSALWYKWRNAEINGDKKDNIPFGWILCPREIPPLAKTIHSGIPYLAPVVDNNKHGNIHYSYISASEKIYEGKYILFLKKLDDKAAAMRGN